MRKEVEALMKNINKQYGMNTLVPAKDLETVRTRISFGSIALDIATGGGVPTGMAVQLSGGFSACKSVILYNVLANAQKTGKKKVLWEKYSTKDNPVYRWEYAPLSDPEAIPLLCALSQSEADSYTNEWGQTIGLEIDELIFNRPYGLEEAIDVATALQGSGELDVQAHDSYAAYKPIQVIETDKQDSVRMGIKQSLLDDYHGKYQSHNNKLSREGKLPTTLIFTNQLREKIGAYGDPEYEPGGRSIGFTVAITVRFRRGDFIYVGSGENKRAIGQVIKFKVTKNKTYKPFQTGEFDFYFDDGGPVPAGCIDNAKELLVEAVCYGILEKAGSWVRYNGKNIAQGVDKAIQTIRNDAKMFAEIKAKVMKIAFNADIEREDVFGDEAVTSDDLIDDIDIDTGVAVAEKKKPAKKPATKKPAPKTKNTKKKGSK